MPFHHRLRPRLRWRAVALVVPLVLAAVSSVLIRSDDHRARRAVAASNATAGSFSVSDGRIVDPLGRTFVPVGVNLGGPHSWIGQATKGLTDSMVAWGFNTVRLVMCAEPTCDMYGNGWDGQSANRDLAAIVDELTARKIVVMLELHNIAPGELPNADQLARIGSWWAQTAATYRNNPYVWFNLFNEPGNGAIVSPAWLENHRLVTNAIRATGAENIVVYDGTQWGQDADNGTGPVANDASAILSFGPTLEQLFDNVVFSLHTYGLWGQPGTAQQRVERLNDFYRRVRAFGGAMLVGETGSWDEHDAQGNAVQATYAFAEPAGVGVLSWTPPGDFALVGATGSFDQIDDPVVPTNLNWFGHLAWDHAHRLAAAGNPQAEPFPLGTPVAAEAFDSTPSSGAWVPGYFGGTVDVAACAGISDGALAVRGGTSSSVSWTPPASVLAPERTYLVRLRARAIGGADRIDASFQGYDDHGRQIADSEASLWVRSTWTDGSFLITTPPVPWSTIFLSLSMSSIDGFLLDQVDVSSFDRDSLSTTTTAAVAETPATTATSTTAARAGAAAPCTPPTVTEPGASHAGSVAGMPDRIRLTAYSHGAG